MAKISPKAIYIAILVIVLIVVAFFIYRQGKPVVYNANTSSASSTSVEVASSTSTTSTTTTSGNGSDVDCKKLKCIALSIDDGPSDYTPKILDVLEAKNVKATFFIWGAKYAGLDYVQREAKDGMEIGNHTWHHKDLTTTSASDTAWEIKTTADSIEAAIGKRPTLLRPPYGRVNDTVRQAAKDAGETIILWDVDPMDWKYTDPQHMIDFFKTGAKRNGIIDMHSRQVTVDAIAGVIDELKAQGFTFVTVSELIGKNNLEPGTVFTSATEKRLPKDDASLGGGGG